MSPTLAARFPCDSFTLATALITNGLTHKKNYNVDILNAIIQDMVVLCIAAAKWNEPEPIVAHVRGVIFHLISVLSSLETETMGQTSQR